jgi:hypothetical protein
MELRPGYKQTEVGLIPEQWQVKFFGQLFQFRNGVNADKDAYGQGTKFINVLEPITYSHIYGTEITGRVELPQAVIASYVLRAGDVLFNRTSETESELGLAATFLGTEEGVFGGFVIRARPTEARASRSLSVVGDAGIAASAPSISARDAIGCVS